MASIIDRDGFKEIRFNDRNGKRRSLYAGKRSRREAERWGRHLDHIVSRQIQSRDPDIDTTEWVVGLADKVYAKLVKLDLVPPRVTEPEPDAVVIPTLRQWTDQYIGSLNVKPGTREQLEISARSLCLHFGDHKPIDSFTIGDAAEYRRWLEREGNERKKYTCGLATNTVRRRIGRAKQFFKAAIDHELIDRNPFAKEESTVDANPEKHIEVPAEWIEKMIKTVNCEDWKIILGFARYAGMRSHETRIQRWDHIDIPNRIMKVRSFKNHKVGQKVVIRTCPIFPELLPHLMRAKEMASGDSEWVVTRYPHDANISTEFDRIAKRAGLVPWSDPFQNLRRTRETELAAHYPATDVTAWLGNSVKVAERHYLMATQASFQRAIRDGASIQGVTAGVDPKAHQKAHHTLHDGQSQEMTPEPRIPQITGNDMQSVLEALSVMLQATPQGFQQVRQNTGVSASAAQDTPKNTPSIADVVDQLGDVLIESLDPDHLDRLIDRIGAS